MEDNNAHVLTSPRKFVERKLSIGTPPSVPLIVATSDGSSSDNFQLQIIPESLNLLESIGKPIAPIAICGPYRTGKSYFLSRILGDLEYFKVGHSTEMCTHGIWMATVVLECDDFVVVFFDTEGISAVGDAKQSSTNFLIISALTSSLVIYNTKKPLQLKDIQKLSWCVTLSQCVQQKSSKCLSLTSSFLWLLRDMDLTVGSISPTEWLLKKLQAPRCKEITDALTNSFSSIECIFLPRPSMKSDVLQNIVQRRDELSPQFNDQLERSKNTLFSKIQPKKCKDGFFTGFSLASLIKQCIADINSSQSQLPNLEATWKTAVDMELQLYANNLVANYEKEMSLSLKEVLPMEEGLADSSDTTTLMGIHNQFITKKVLALENKLLSLVPIKDVRDDFWKAIYGNFINRIIEKEADGKIVGGVLATFLHENQKLSNELCLKTYATFYDQIVATRLRSSIAEGIPYDITEDIQQFKDQYNKVACGPAKAEVFSTKRQECMVEENKLLQIPGPIEHLQIIGIGSDCIKLTWQKPSVNTTAAHAYEVYMVEEQGNLVLVDTTTNCYVLIKHLKSNQHYTFVVRAKNDHYCGNHVSHASARTSMNAISRTAFGVGTYFAFTVGSPVVFPTIFAAGTIASIRSDVNKQRYGTAVAKSAALTLLPLVLPLGAFATAMAAPIIANGAFSESGPKGDTSEDAPCNSLN